MLLRAIVSRKPRKIWKLSNCQTDSSFRFVNQKIENQSCLPNYNIIFSKDLRSEYSILSSFKGQRSTEYQLLFRGRCDFTRWMQLIEWPTAKTNRKHTRRKVLTNVSDVSLRDIWKFFVATSSLLLRSLLFPPFSSLDPFFPILYGTRMISCDFWTRQSLQFLHSTRDSSLFWGLIFTVLLVGKVASSK